MNQNSVTLSVYNLPSDTQAPDLEQVFSSYYGFHEAILGVDANTDK